MVFADTINLYWKNYDGTTYQNSTCTVNGDLEIPSTPPTRYGYTFTGWKISNYIPIEYLESTGTQYIDTGLIANETTEAEIEFYDYIKNGSENPLFMVTNNGWSDRNFGVNMSSTNYITFYMNCDGYTNHSHVYQGNIKLLLNGIYLDGEKQTITRGSIPSTTSFTTTYPIYIFVDNRGGTPTYFTKYKLKYLKFWDRGTIVRDFIPALDKNGTPCLFDRVEAKFYYNKGTGNFIAGPTL